MIDGKVWYQGNAEWGLFAQCSVSAGLKVSSSIAKFVKGNNAVALTLGEFAKQCKNWNPCLAVRWRRRGLARMDCGVTVSGSANTNVPFQHGGVRMDLRGEMDAGYTIGRKLRQ